jgi:hypothetical protein
MTVFDCLRLATLMRRHSSDLQLEILHLKMLKAFLDKEIGLKSLHFELHLFLTILNALARSGHNKSSYCSSLFS